MLTRSEPSGFARRFRDGSFDHLSHVPISLLLKIQLSTISLSGLEIVNSKVTSFDLTDKTCLIAFQSEFRIQLKFSYFDSI